MKRFLAVPFLLVVLIGCSRLGDAADEKSPPRAGVHGGEPKTEEEKIVAAHVQKSRKSVEWLRWGPHDFKGESHLKGKDYKIVRVRFRSAAPGYLPVIDDCLYELFTTPDGKVHPTRGPANTHGDDWLEKAKKAKKDALEKNRKVTDEKPAPP